MNGWDLMSTRICLMLAVGRPQAIEAFLLHLHKGITPILFKINESKR